MSEHQHRTFAITHATLIDGTGSAPLEGATAIIEDDRVVSVASSESAGVPEGIEQLNAKGRWLLP